MTAGYPVMMLYEEMASMMRYLTLITCVSSFITNIVLRVIWPFTYMFSLEILMRKPWNTYMSSRSNRILSNVSQNMTFNELPKLIITFFIFQSSPCIIMTTRSLSWGCISVASFLENGSGHFGGCNDDPHITMFRIWLKRLVSWRWVWPWSVLPRPHNGCQLYFLRVQ